MTAPIHIRPVEPADADACARICFDAFTAIGERFGLPPDFPSPAYARAVIDSMIANPPVFGLVAERNGQVLGSSFLDERDAVRGVGPVSVDPREQGGGVGRRLMEAVLERGGDAASVRLLQDAHNPVSLSLYASLGFEVKEPVALLRGRPRSRPPNDVEVRLLRPDEMEECSELCRAVHGFHRNNGLASAFEHFHPVVAIRDGRVVGYASTLVAWPIAHGVAETHADMHALILGGAATGRGPMAFLVPTRSELFAWAVREGFRTVKSMNLMSVGSYQEPRGSWFPSVGY